MTATVRAHVLAMHPRVQPARSNEETGRRHAADHHRFGSHSHYHAGVNRGANERPPGWRTGEDVVPKS